MAPNEQPKDIGAAPRSVDWNNPRVAAILDAAAKCFARKGFSATTLAEIGKELGLRKSIVHYYFASKAALVHEVQSYTYQKYLDRVKEAIVAAGGSSDPAHTAMRALWAAVGEGDVGLNIEVWSASRNDEELKRRARALQEEKRKVIEDGLRALLGPDGASRVPLRPLSTLVMSVLNGLAVSEYVEGQDAQVRSAYEMFLTLLSAGGRQPGTLAHNSTAPTAGSPTAASPTAGSPTAASPTAASPTAGSPAAPAASAAPGASAPAQPPAGVPTNRVAVAPSAS